MCPVAYAVDLSPEEPEIIIISHGSNSTNLTDVVDEFHNLSNIINPEHEEDWSQQRPLDLPHKSNTKIVTG